MKSILTINKIFHIHKEHNIIKQGLYKNVKYEIQQNCESDITFYIEFNEENITYYTPVNFEHLEEDFDFENSEKIFDMKDIVLKDCGSVPEKKYHMIKSSDSMYNSMYDNITPINDIIKDIEKCIDGIIEYQEIGLKLYEVYLK
jgi:hypothetical protein